MEGMTNVWKRSLKTTSQGRKVLSRKRPGPCIVSPEQARLYNSYTAQCDRNGGFTEEDIVLPYHLQKSRLLDQLYVVPLQLEAKLCHDQSMV